MSGSSIEQSSVSRTAQMKKSKPQSHASEDYWRQGRVVVHEMGSEAGLLRLDIQLDGVSDSARAQKMIQLMIPGEVSPLTANSAVGDNGRFVLSYFSSDIANGGHLPAEAIARWQTDDGGQHEQPVRIVSAATVAQNEGDNAVRIPGGEPTVVYPRTVLLMAILGVLVLIIAAMLMLSRG